MNATADKGSNRDAREDTELLDDVASGHRRRMLELAQKIQGLHAENAKDLGVLGEKKGAIEARIIEGESHAASEITTLEQRYNSVIEMRRKSIRDLEEESHSITKTLEKLTLGLASNTGHVKKLRSNIRRSSPQGRTYQLINMSGAFVLFGADVLIASNFTAFFLGLARAPIQVVVELFDMNSGFQAQLLAEAIPGVLFIMSPFAFGLLVHAFLHSHEEYLKMTQYISIGLLATFLLMMGASVGSGHEVMQRLLQGTGVSVFIAALILIGGILLHLAIEDFQKTRRGR